MTNDFLCKHFKFAFIFCLTISVAACGLADDNDKAVYGKESGLPVNCRAYVQVAVNDYKAGKYPIDAIMSGLERNCGENGWSWKNKRRD